jgi:tRNA modification GTPase
MEFIHRPYQPGETIAAIATPPGEGGISIIRLSGVRAIEIAEKIFSGPVASYKSHTLHLGIVHDGEGKCIDEALLLLMRAPRSYTGEDTVELQCHGGMIASKKILEACLKEGARAAMPGEFTFKAFMNGKLDLAQAEAVQKLIGAKNEEAFAAANDHLRGALSKKISEFQKELVRLGAIFEAWVDFPEEGIEFASQEELLEDLLSLSQAMQRLLNTFEDGKKIDQGISLCIVGAPNAGKSSLMNALLDQERAIVTEIAGTTRDLLHEELTIGSLHFKLTDTAGIRQTTEIVEQEGIRRSREAIEKADLILFVIDAAKRFGSEEQELFSILPKAKTIVLLNKMDIAPCALCQTPFLHELRISAKEKSGLDKLKERIEQLIWQNGMPSKDEIFITSLRHKEALSRAIHNIDSVRKGLIEGVSPEFLTADLRSSLAELGRIIGTNITEEILSSIFSQFCIGK